MPDHLLSKSKTTVAERRGSYNGEEEGEGGGGGHWKTCHIPRAKRLEKGSLRRGKQPRALARGGANLKRPPWGCEHGKGNTGQTKKKEKLFSRRTRRNFTTRGGAEVEVSEKKGSSGSKENPAGGKKYHIGQQQQLIIRGDHLTRLVGGEGIPRGGNRGFVGEKKGEK